MRFETPEHVAISYELAGLGTRFAAWVNDFLIVVIAEIVIAFITIILITMATDLASTLGDMFDPVAITVGLVLIAFGFLPIAYFLISEKIMNGQTWGKRSVGIRVVMAEGFSLTFSSLVIRNVFRVVDTIPFLWLVPFISARAQRFGDMVAGTVVIHEHQPDAQGVQMQLLQRAPAAATFLFASTQLARLSEADFAALEAFLSRRASLGETEQTSMSSRLATALADRMDYVPRPDPCHYGVFLEDLLAAHLQRQLRSVG